MQELQSAKQLECHSLGYPLLLPPPIEWCRKQDWVGVKRRIGVEGVVEFLTELQGSGGGIVIEL